MPHRAWHCQPGLPLLPPHAAHPGAERSDSGAAQEQGLPARGCLALPRLQGQRAQRTRHVLPVRSLTYGATPRYRQL